ncbi:MAG: NAD(P)/FAD-dependent oxidoreductase [Dehalococcoidia bacterium]
MVKTSNVVVVGAGVVGCSVAYYLAAQGIKVTLFEKESIGSGASAHATGSLSLLGAEFAPGPSFQLALTGFREFPDLVKSLEAATGMDLLYQRRPSLRLALDAEEEELIKGMMPWQQDSVAMRWIDASEVHRMEPRLTSQIRGAVYENESAQLDSYRLNLALARAAELKGADIQLREVTGLVGEGRVSAVKTASGEHPCDAVVAAAGTWSHAFEEWLGYPVPVRPLKGERLLLRYRGDPLPVLISSPKRGHMISRLDGLLSVGSTGGRDYDQEDLFWGEEFDRRPTEGAKVELLQRAIDVFPALLEEAELVQQLAGSRPLSPDRQPIIGPVPGWENVILATGHTTKGIHLGPITGRIIAEYLLNGPTNLSVDLEAFLPSRFSNLAPADYYASGQTVEE